MDVFEFALNMEKEGEDTYRQLAAESQSPGLKNIFKMLAEEERKHFLILEEIKNNIKVEGPLSAEMNPSAIFKNLVDKESGLSVPINEIEVYKECLKVEEQSRDFYRQEATRAVSESARRGLLLLADEEQRHMVLLENIIEHVSYPEDHVEHAEFSNKLKIS